LVNKLEGPSSVGKDVPGFSKHFQQAPIPLFYNGRPATALSPIPAQLLVPAFQHLITASSPGGSEGSYEWSCTTSWDGALGTRDPILLPACSEEDYHLRFAQHLSLVMSQTFEKESLRVEQLQMYLKHLFPEEGGYKFRSSKSGESAADIIVTCSWPQGGEGDLEYPLLIIEVKNEAGVSGDAGLQGTTYYAKEVAKEGGPIQASLAFSFGPSLLLEVVGPQLRMSALAFGGGRVICQPLTSMLNLLDLHVPQPDQVCGPTGV
jgi:hypothetical protein